MAGKLKYDLKGKKFGSLTAVEYLGKSKWRCMCDCGHEKIVNSYFLRNGQQTDCGHCNKSKRKNNTLLDLTGQKFGEWTVIEYVGDSKWLCKCSCGNTGIVHSYTLRSGNNKSCGCKRRISLLGRKFGEWTVLRYTGNGRWLCRCSCGTTREVSGSALKRGSTKSCGHDTTGFKDLTGQKFGEWTVIKRYDGENKDSRSSTSWVCRCSCGNESIVTSYALRNEHSMSCGCKSIENRIRTCNNLYGVDFSSQIGTDRSPEQLVAIKSEENLRTVISTFFRNKKPKTQELADVLGLDRASTMVYIQRYNLEGLVEIGVQNSIYEDELCKLFPTEHRGVRGIIGRKEIDLYYPKHKIGIEFNGNYWHSELKKHKQYHLEKTRLAASKGIDIIHIFEYEWLEQSTKAKIINLIENRLELCKPTRVNGRDTLVKEITVKESREFLEKYHLQGNVASRVRLGLYWSDKLIGVMTFGTPRFGDKYEYELIRLAWNKDYRVIGGTQKLFKHFVREYKPSSIISYCDLSKFNGEVYFKLGFNLVGISEPNYKWVSIKGDNIVLSRYKTQKHKLVRLGYGSNTQTEVEIMQSLGFLRVYDCGNAKFTWINN